MVKESCLEQMIFFGEASLRNAVRKFIAHYHGAIIGLGNRLMVPMEVKSDSSGVLQQRRRLGGVLNYYYRDAA